jgi:hypothetical protein
MAFIKLPIENDADLCSPLAKPYKAPHRDVRLAHIRFAAFSTGLAIPTAARKRDDNRAAKPLKNVWGASTSSASRIDFSIFDIGASRECEAFLSAAPIEIRGL